MTSQRALATLVSRGTFLDSQIRAMRALAADLPLTIRIEINNLQEVLDLLRHKFREETLRGVLHRSSDVTPARTGLPTDARKGNKRDIPVRSSPFADPVDPTPPRQERRRKQ